MIPDGTFIELLQPEQMTTFTSSPKLLIELDTLSTKVFVVDFNRSKKLAFTTGGESDVDGGDDISGGTRLNPTLRLAPNLKLYHA